jgi:hypothetical protein
MSAALNQATLLQLLQLVASAGAAAARQRAIAQGTQASVQARAHEVDLAAKVRALEIAAQQEQSQQHAALLSQVIESCKHVEDRKFDLVEQAFQATHSLLVQQQTALIAERKEVAKEKSQTPSTETRKLIYLRRREGEITTELADIRRMDVMLSMHVQTFAHDSGFPIHLPRLPAVY